MTISPLASKLTSTSAAFIFYGAQLTSADTARKIYRKKSLHCVKCSPVGRELVKQAREQRNRIRGQVPRGVKQEPTKDGRGGKPPGNRWLPLSYAATQCTQFDQFRERPAPFRAEPEYSVVEQLRPRRTCLLHACEQAMHPTTRHDHSRRHTWRPCAVVSFYCGARTTRELRVPLESKHRRV